MRTSGSSDDARHWLIERRVRVYPRIILVMFVLTIPLYAMTFEGGVDPRGQPLGSDFVLFWSAGRMSVDGAGLEVWDLSRIAAVELAQFPGLAGPIPWAYPPATLLLVTPLGLLSYPVAYVLWTVAGLVAFLAALRPLVHRLPFAWTALLAFPGLWLGIASGHTQFFVAALAGGALLLIAPRPVLAGVLIGLLVIKPHLAILFPFALLAGGHRTAFAAAAASATAFMAAGAAVFGTGAISAWFDGMRQLGSGVDAGAFRGFKVVSPYGSLRTLQMPSEVALLVQGVTSVVVIVMVCLVWRRTLDIRLRGSAVVLGTFLAAPYSMDYDLALLAFPIAWMTMLGLEQGWRRGERNGLVAAWVLPLLTAPIAVATHVTITPIVVGLLLWQVWARTPRNADRGRTAVKT